MHKAKPVFIVLVLLLAFAGNLKAQATWEVGGTIGGSGYIGDFNPVNPVKFTDPCMGGFLKRNFNSYFSLKLSYMYGTIQGADSTSSNQQMVNRNLSFSSSLSELSLIAEFNLMKYIPEVGDNKYTPFIFVGIGSTFFDPKANYKGLSYDLLPLATEGQTGAYRTQTWVIPYGAGMKFNFTGKWNFIVDLGYRSTNTGYLDDVYGAYPDKTRLTPISAAFADRSGEKTGVYIGSPGTQRGNYTHDTYMFLGFTLSYTFVTQDCYRFN
jgi:hypothetical protein